MTSYWFSRRLAGGNGEIIPRRWLIYSPLKKSAFYFCCILYADSPLSKRSSLEKETGFRSWRKPEKIAQHENSPTHRTAFIAWKEAENRLLRGNSIDNKLENQIKNEEKRWRSVLNRILTAVKYLAKQNLAFRGHEEY